MTYRIRTMNREEIDLAVEWAAQEGWNPGLNDADSFYAADPTGFLIGLLDEEPVACISVVKYSSTFSFLGFYIVRPEVRGRGFGLQIWNAGLERLKGCNIGLDGVVDQQENYKRSGFRLAYRNIRYEGSTGGEMPEHPGLVDLSSLPFEVIKTYDQPFFPADRSRFLCAWLSQPDSRAFGVVHNNRLGGYGVIRACRNGYKVGPLFADSPEQAELLFRALRASVKPEQPVYLDTPEPNKEALALADRFQMKAVFETARMYTGPFPNLPMSRLFGVTSFELG